MLEPDECILGKTATLRATSSAEDNRALALAMVRQARRQVLLFTHDLDRPLFDDAGWVAAVSALVRRRPRNHCHILVRDSGEAVRRGHRLVALGQRLGSRVRFHNPSADYDDVQETFLLVDGVGWLRRKLWSRYEGEACFADPPRARELTARFAAIWERSWPDPGLRALLI